ncbi:serine/threonine protein phosphatase [Synechococcales cyanobacterium C]|uniref:Serine/threonine protein phosphatase n=2 Tax=Petrachloros TaxID=2918834 RepID=A0A8K1ZWP8_9CYAN|nr:serine/threonine protein phosphatase [Petrachloros mirabilis ULC683]
MDLLALVELINADQLYFLGDLIDRGPDSNKVVEFVKSHDHTCLMGNHEQMMCHAFPPNQATDPWFLQMWLGAGGRDTLESYHDPEQLQAHVEWLHTLPLYLDLGDLWLVHAGLDPTRPPEAQTEREFCWIRNEFHQAQEPYFADKLIVTGHTITFTFKGVSPGQLAQGPGWLDIDTGAYHPKSGWMTALDIDQKQVYQVNVFDHDSRICSLAEATDWIDTRTKRHWLFF